MQDEVSNDAAAALASLVERIDSYTGSGFLSNKDLIEEGDTVIVYVNHETSYAVDVRRGCTLTMKYGALKHEYIIGKKFGSRVSATAGYVYVLRPTADLWTRALKRHTQILYTPDCALILMLLDIKPGSIVCECGTGSGSLSHAAAMAIAPSGHLYTHDVEETRLKQVEQNLKNHGLGDVTTCIHQDVIADGFFVENACDAVFLDLPAPWDAIPHAKQALSRSRGGRLVSFSPCIEQVQRACSVLISEGFVQIETVELVPRKLKAIEYNQESLEHFATPGAPGDRAKREEERRAAKRRRLEDGMECSTASDADRTFALVPFPFAQPTHTGYITSATLLPCIESE